MLHVQCASIADAQLLVSAIKLCLVTQLVFMCIMLYCYMFHVDLSFWLPFKINKYFIAISSQL